MSSKRRQRGTKAAGRGQNEPQPQQQAPWALTGVLMATAAFGGLTTPALAQAPAPASSHPGDERLSTRHFEIPAGPLDAALAAFTRTSGLTVIDPQALAGGRQSPGALGVLTDEEALRRVLVGTGLRHRFTSARQVRLESAEVTTLAEVKVQARQQQRSSSAKYAGPLRDVPQTITVVPQAVLEQQGAVTLRDAVRNVPGITVNAGEGGATPGDNFNIRGFSARTDLFVDGVRDVGGYARATFNVEQVEVAKGPGSAYTGRGSTGGAINVVTKTPRLQRAYQSELSVGTAEEARATVDLNQPLSALGVPGAAVRLNAEVQTAGVAGLEVVENNAWGVAPSFALGLGTPTRVTAQVFHAEQDNTPTYGLHSNNTDGPPAGIDTRNFFGLRGLDFEDVRANQASARVEHDLSGALTLRNQLTYSTAGADRIVTAANPDGTRRLVSHITRDRNLTNQTSLNARFATGTVEHVASAGVEVAHERSRFGAYRFSAPPPRIADLNAPNPDDPYTGTVEPGRDRRSARATSVGVYAIETLRLGSAVELNGAVRWDRFAPEYRDSMGVVTTEPGAANEALTWRAGLVVKPAEHGSVYAAYGTSFNPTGELLALDRNGSTGLDPERNRSVELGTKWEVLGERLLLTAAGFRTEKTNARITDPNDPSGGSLVLAGRQRVQGLELGASGAVAEGLGLFAGYTYLESEILTGAAADIGRPLPNTPKHALTLWTTYRLPWEIEIGAGARHLSRRVMSTTSSVPPYWAFDAEAAVPLSNHLGLRLNVYNLANATYYDANRYWVPAAGRSVRLTTSLDF